MSAPTGEKPPWRAASANVDGVKGADTMSATETPSPAPAILRLSEISGSLFLALNYLRYHNRARSETNADRIGRKRRQDVAGSE